jgi:hypothetical protein
MKTFALIAALGVCGAASAPAPSLDLLQRAIDPNPTLTTYTASARLSATLHVLLPDHKTFTGVVYYLKPRRKIEFSNVPGALSRFKDLAATTPTYDEATAQYAITPVSDDGTVSTYSFVPKKPGGRVKSLTVRVDDAAALITHAQWLYTNGGKLDFDQTYERVGIFRLPAKADVAARFPGYSVDGTLTFGNYQLNVPVSPSVFATP